MEREYMANVVDINKAASIVTYVICKVCSVERHRVKNGRYPNGKDFRYVDQNNREWSGRVCPGCHSARNANRQMRVRKVRKLYV